MDSPFVTIDSYFEGKDFRVSYPGRNDDVLALALRSLRRPLQNILLLGSGPYEPWILSSQKNIRNKEVQIIALDADWEITNINKIIKERGEISDELLIKITEDDTLFNSERRLRTIKNFLKSTDDLSTSGISLARGLFRVDSLNRKNVIVEEAKDALEYVKTNNQKFDLIFSGNLENNLLFQPTYTYESAIQFHTNIAHSLRKNGLYVFTTNELFFNEHTTNDKKNIIEILNKSGLEILFKATQFVSLITTKTERIIVENCAIISCKRGDYDSFPFLSLAENRIKNTRVKLEKDLLIREYVRPLDDYFLLSANEQNLAFVKMKQNFGFWLNAVGSYSQIFGLLGTFGQGFYPGWFILHPDSD